MEITFTNEAVEHFSTFPEHKKLLEEIAEIVPSYFLDTSLHCELIEDDIFVGILTKLSVKEAKIALDRFDDEWWLDRCLKSPFCVDFISV